MENSINTTNTLTILHDAITHVDFKYSNSISPILYIPLKIALTYFSPDTNERIGHIGIMSTISLITGTTKSYYHDGDYAEALSYGSHSAAKSAIKFGSRELCMQLPLGLQTHDKSFDSIKKFTCTVSSSFLTYMVYSDWHDLNLSSIYNYALKSISSGMATTLANHARKYIASFTPSEKYDKFSSIDKIFINELKSLPSNLVHTIFLSTGKPLFNQAADVFLINSNPHKALYNNNTTTEDIYTIDQPTCDIQHPYSDTSNTDVNTAYRKDFFYTNNPETCDIIYPHSYTLFIEPYQLISPSINF